MRELVQEILHRVKLYFRHRLVDALHPLFFVFHATDQQRLFQNLLHAHKWRQRPIRILLNIANVKAIIPQVRACQLGKILAFKNKFAARWNVDSQNRFHQAGLAASTLPDDCHCFSLSHLKADAVHRFDVANMAEAEAAQFIPYMQIANG